MAPDTSRPILVTGATGGFGPTMVERLLRDYTVVAMYRAADAWQELQQALGSPGNLHGLQGDLGDPAGLERELARVREQTGPLYGLVHLAGGFSGGSVAETDLAAWQRMLTLNLTNAFVAIRAVLPQLQERGTGRIVAVGSAAVARRPAGLAGYTVSKAGLHALIEVLAKELKDSGITANIVLPESLATPAMTAGTDSSKLVPLQQVAETIAFLLGDGAANISGAGIPLVPGGAAQ